MAQRGQISEKVWYIAIENLMQFCCLFVQLLLHSLLFIYSIYLSFIKQLKKKANKRKITNSTLKFCQLMKMILIRMTARLLIVQSNFNDIQFIKVNITIKSSLFFLDDRITTCWGLRTSQWKISKNYSQGKQISPSYVSSHFQKWHNNQKMNTIT